MRSSGMTAAWSTRSWLRSWGQGRGIPSVLAAQDVDDGGVVEPAEAGAAPSEVELLGGGRQRGGVGAGAGGVGDESHVLDEDVQGALDLLEGSADHSLAAVVEHEGGRRPVPDDLPGGFGV